MLVGNSKTEAPDCNRFAGAENVAASSGRIEFQGYPGPNSHGFGRSRYSSRYEDSNLFRCQKVGWGELAGCPY